MFTTNYIANSTSRTNCTRGLFAHVSAVESRESTSHGSLNAFAWMSLSISQSAAKPTMGKTTVGQTPVGQPAGALRVGTPRSGISLPLGNYAIDGSTSPVIAVT